MRRWGGRGGGAAAAYVAAAGSLLLAGCVSLPTSGTVHGVFANSDLAQGNQVGMVPRSPEPQWTPQQIVSGFLAASGADTSVARQYLTSGYSGSWRPSLSPHVIDTNYKVMALSSSGHVTNGQSGTAQVAVSSQHLEILVAARNGVGRLQVSSAAAPYVFNFALVLVRGKWRIDGVSGLNGSPSNTTWLLTNSDFLRDYQPRNLYYPASGSLGALVPYPVYISDQSRLLGVPDLVDALRTLPSPDANWLYRDVVTGFPSGTKVRGVQVQGTKAVIDLGGSAANANAQVLHEIEAQLVWTLTNPAYSGGTGIRSVELLIGHKSRFLLPSAFAHAIPQSGTQPLYFQTLDRRGYPVLEIFKVGTTFSPDSLGGTGSGHAAKALHSPVVLPAGLGRGPFTAFAISPPVRGGQFTTFGGCRGKDLYVVPLLVGSDLNKTSLPGNCNSLTWDDQGELWVTEGPNVFVVTQTLTGLRVVPVAIPPLSDPTSYSSLKVAPDGLRVAMIVRGASGLNVFVTAIHKKGSLIYLAQSGQLMTVGPDLANPIALSWWDADHLLVLDRRDGLSELRVVPLDGGQSSKIPTPPGAASVAASGAVIAVGTTGPGGRGPHDIQVSRAVTGLWQSAANGSTPVYPG